MATQIKSSMPSSGEGRPYRKRKRATQEQRTRERITEATVALHESLGPANTTVKAIADRAGVQRATVYRHFPDEQTLFDSCTAHYFALHPMPDPGRWADRPVGERLRRALAELYEWYSDTEQMTYNSLRDMEHVPQGTRDAFFGYFVAVQDALMRGRPERGRARSLVAAALGHATAFTTWRSLVREQGLDNGEAAELMVALVDAVPPAPGSDPAGAAGAPAG
jgi:AcrR family transcriptional regulator